MGAEARVLYILSSRRIFKKIIKSSQPRHKTEWKIYPKHLTSCRQLNYFSEIRKIGEICILVCNALVMKISTEKMKVIAFKGKKFSLLQNNYFKLNYKMIFMLQIFIMWHIL
jgi:hypothetical protein